MLFVREYKVFDILSDGWEKFVEIFCIIFGVFNVCWLILVLILYLYNCNDLIYFSLKIKFNNSNKIIGLIGKFVVKFGCKGSLEF